MPLYDYECRKCGHEFEVLIRPGSETPKCSSCGSEELEAVSDGELTNFFCAACHRCWHVELG